MRQERATRSLEDAFVRVGLNVRGHPLTLGLGVPEQLGTERIDRLIDLLGHRGWGVR
jgi:hypothetical protein